MTPWPVYDMLLVVGWRAGPHETRLFAELHGLDFIHRGNLFGTRKGERHDADVTEIACDCQPLGTERFCVVAFVEGDESHNLGGVGGA